MNETHQSNQSNLNDETVIIIKSKQTNKQKVIKPRGLSLENKADRKTSWIENKYFFFIFCLLSFFLFLFFCSWRECALKRRAVLIPMVFFKSALPRHGKPSLPLICWAEKKSICFRLSWRDIFKGWLTKIRKWRIYWRLKLFTLRRKGSR